MHGITSRKSFGKDLARGPGKLFLGTLLASAVCAVPVHGASVGSTGAGHEAAVRDTSEAPTPKSERWLREQILLLDQLDRPEIEAAVNGLKQASRAEVLAILRDDLRANPVSAPLVTLKAVVLLQAKELAPELKAIAERTEDWVVFARINALVAHEPALRAEFTKVYLRRLPVLLASTAKVAVLEGLSDFKVAVGDEAFADLLVSSNHDVRISAVRNLLETYTSLKRPERLRRLVLALDARPKQARILAMRTVPRLPASERKELSSLLTIERCNRESDRMLSSACRSALKSLGPGGGR